IPTVENRDRILIADERDNQVFAARERHALQVDREVILCAAVQRLDAVRMRSDGETLQIVGGAMHPDDDVDRLRWIVGVHAYTNVDVLAALEEVARTSAAVAHDDIAEADR